MRTQLPQNCDERTRSWFAWLPVTIGNERRWLERVTVRQRCRYFTNYFSGAWENIAFVDSRPEQSRNPAVRNADQCMKCGTVYDTAQCSSECPHLTQDETSVSLTLVSKT